jgi:adenylate cyclase
LGPEVSREPPRPKGLLAPLILAAAALAVAFLGAWNVAGSFDAQIHDRFTRLLAEPGRKSAVVIVDIDESSLAQIGPWPWPRSVMGELIHRLRERGALLQVWDVHFAEPAAGDEVFSAALAAPQLAGKQPDVVLGQVLVLDPKVQSAPLQGALRPSSSSPAICADLTHGISGHLGVAESLSAATAIGHLTATPDADGGLRRLPAVVCRGDDRFPQLALAAVERLAPTDPWLVTPGNPFIGPDRWLTRGSWRFAVDGQGFLPIPYRHDHAQWPAVTALQVLEGRDGGVDLRGRVVLVGATALGLADTVSTPFHANAPGVSVHAELLAAAGAGSWVVQPPHRLAAVMGIFLLGAALMWFVMPVLGRPPVMLPLGFLVALVPVGLAFLARLGHVQLPITVPATGLVLFALALAALQIDRERRQSRLLAAHLESVLPRELAMEIARQRPNGETLGRPGTGVLMAVRVVGLERWSAAVDSLHALALVHGISMLVERHSAQQGGRLEQLQGETLLSIWRLDDSAAVPGLQSEEQRQAAVESALRAARSLLAELRDLLRKSEGERHPLGLSIALEVGPYLLAVAGSPTARRPLLLGAAVDSALGLLPLCEELASPLLLGQTAAAAKPRVTLLAMGSFLLPDGASPQVVHRVEP